MKLSSKLAICGGVLAGAGAVAFSMLARKQREEIYHEAEIKAMDELDEMMEQAGECAGCTCAKECADLQGSAFDPAEAAKHEERRKHLPRRRLTSRKSSRGGAESENGPRSPRRRSVTRGKTGKAAEK